MLAATASTPRRVGDGGEYVVMARQLAAGRAPSVTAAELGEARAALAELGGGFETSLLEYPALVGRDGRQEFLHFFLYPLITAPALLAVSALGVHPNWAFSVVNATLLATALFITARRVSLAAIVAGFVSPIIWWVDKAHTEAFLFATVAAAALLFRHQPAVAALAFALAGAQNAALGATYPAFALMLWAATRTTTWTARAWVSVGAGLLLISSPFAYNWLRLGRWSPMAEYAQPSLPSVAGLLAFVVEPNIGVLPNAPVYALSLLAGIGLLVARRAFATARSPFWWWPAVIQVLLLLAWAQNPNANHGGTPGMNRWVLSLLALGLPWIDDVYRQLSGVGRASFAALVVAASVTGAITHLPQRPESYREPTRAAEWMWRRGWVHVTPAEVFAERTQRREPAFAPAHDGECGVLLIANQQAPAACAPPLAPLPPACREPDALCYAVASGAGTRYLRAPANGFFYHVAGPSWPAGGPLATGLQRAMDAADPEVRVWRVEDARPWRERLPGANVGAVVASDHARVVYLTRASRASLHPVAGDATVQAVTLIPFGGVDATAEELTNVALLMRRADSSVPPQRP